MKKYSLHKWFDGITVKYIYVTKEEYEELAKKLAAAGYTWRSGDDFTKYSPFDVHPELEAIVINNEGAWSKVARPYEFDFEEKKESKRDLKAESPEKLFSELVKELYESLEKEYDERKSKEVKDNSSNKKVSYEEEDEEDPFAWMKNYFGDEDDD